MTQTLGNPPTRTSRKWLWLLVPALLFAGSAAFAAIRFDAIVNSYKDQYLPELSTLLGRPVAIGKISTSVLTGVGVRVDDLVVGKDPKDTNDPRPFLELKKLQVSVSIWPLITSGGKKIHINEVLVDGLALNLVRYADGTLNLDHILEQVNKNKKPPEPMSEETRTLIRGFKLGRFDLSDAHVRFVDLERDSAVVEISKINLEILEASVLAPFNVSLSAAILTNTPNFTLSTQLGVTPKSFEEAPPVIALKVDLKPTNLSPIAPFIATRVPGLTDMTAAAHIDATLGAAAPGGTGPTALNAEVKLAQMKFKEGSQAFDLNAVTELTADANKGDVDLKRLDISAADMAIKGKGKLLALKSTPRFENVLIESQGVNFDKIRKLYPALDQSAGATLGGPLELRVAATGDQSAQTFNVRLDLTGASIVKDDVFAKPAGVVLRFAAGGELKPDALLLTLLSFELADLNLRGQGSVTHFKSPSFDLQATAQTADLTGLAHLSPKAAASIPANQSVAGVFAVDAKAKGTTQSSQMSANLQLTQADLKTPDMRVVGNAHLNVQANMRRESDETQSMSATVDADLSALDVHYGDAFNKASGVPFVLQLKQKGLGAAEGKVSDTQFDLKLAALSANGHANLRGETFPTFDAALRFSNFDTLQMKSMLPSLAASDVKAIRVDGDMNAQGQVGHPDKMHVQIKELNVKAGQSDLKGKLVLNNLVKPSFDLEAHSGYLDMTDFVADKPAKKEEKSDRSALSNLRGHVLLTVAKGKAARLAYDTLKCDLNIDAGRATAKTMSVNALGGTFSGNGTELSVVDEHGPFHMLGQIDNLDLDQTTGYLMNTKGVIRGRFSGKVDLKGVGTTPDEMKAHLDGKLKGQIIDVTFLAGNLAESIAKPLSAKLPFLKGSKLAPPKFADPHAKPAKATIIVKDGALVLEEPLETDSALGPLSLAGKTFLNTKLDMKGDLHMAPAAASQLVGNTVKLSEPLPVKLKIGGTLTKPNIAPTELESVAKIYLAAYAKGALNSALGQEANKLLQNSPAGKLLDKVGPLPTSKAEAEAKAKQVADEAKAKAEQEAREQQARAQAEAQARADAVKREAQERARQEAERAKQAADAERRAAQERAKQEGAKRLKGLFGK